MSVRVGFLRAVNLGRRRVPMSTLVEMCEGLVDTPVVRGADVHWRMHGTSTDSRLIRLSEVDHDT